MVGRWCVARLPSRHQVPLLSLRAWACHPCTRRHVRLLGPCFKTGRRPPFRPRPHPCGEVLSTMCGSQGCLISVPCPSRTPRPREPARPTIHATKGGAGVGLARTGGHRFPLSCFRYFVSLFSKFFASFLHSTCLLSVSCQYLALDGVYHPIRAAISSNPTRRKRVVMQPTSRQTRGSHPL